MKLTLFTTLLSAAALTAVQAMPFMPRDVFVPPVLTPTAGEIWTVGSQQNVTWDVSDPPVNITNKQGLILLRKAGLTTPRAHPPPSIVRTGLTVYNAVILGNGFDILDGTFEVTVPDVLEGTDYSITLFGDSGNFSPVFTITGSGVNF
ncbi:hypothetical protein C8R47DRAFT_1075096 [Mycena vitilis]|nr:hypothetical protein C8R47DRAFT_1075096 [Mycena vitilis]